MKRVLIVDDSKTFQKLIEHQLKGQFHIVGKGSSGIEGYDLFQSLKPDLVLLDIVMPNCGGKECLQKILASNPQANVIMVSSVGDDATIQECLKLGAKAFVRKDQISQSDTGLSPFLTTVLKVTGGTVAEAA